MAAQPAQAKSRSRRALLYTGRPGQEQSSLGPRQAKAAAKPGPGNSREEPELV